jgi:hypothetical protein
VDISLKRLPDANCGYRIQKVIQLLHLLLQVPFHRPRPQHRLAKPTRQHLFTFHRHSQILPVKFAPLYSLFFPSASAPDRWTSLAPSLALQILRSTRTPLTRLPYFESILGFHLSNPRSRLYQEAELRVLSQLYPALRRLVEAYTPLTGLQIFEAATVPNIVGGLGVPANGAREEIGEIATRIAHIGMLHWRVWAPLAYLIDPDGEEGDAIH